jgi:NAD-dependent dihydropyrimidine dehydrogenase PreA subunit
MAIEKIEGCIGCGECVDACPVDVLRFDQAENKAVIKYPEDCQICNLCVIYCPVGAITLTNEKSAQVMVSW